jgi:hypothetical protein
MKLYTRLINEGVFIFWNPDEGNTSYSLKIKIAVGDDKVELVNLETRKGENYYSFSGIGSGDYEIELNGFKDNRLYQTETKKIKIVSSVQKEQEQADKSLAWMSKMYDKLSSIDDNLLWLYLETTYSIERKDRKNAERAMYLYSEHRDDILPLKLDL